MKKGILILVSAFMFLMACESQHHCPTYNDAGPKHHHKAPASHAGK